MFYIYRTTNLINGKTYIGQREFSLGKKDTYMGKGVVLRRAQKKYGIENFKKDIIEVVLSQFEANVLEKYYIAKERAKVGRENCYNIANGGQGGNLGEEVNKKISEANKDKPKSEEHKKKIAETLKGNIPWNRGKSGLQTAWNKGMKGEQHHTEETKKRIGDTLKGHPGYWKGKTAHNKGKPMPDKQRIKMDEVREAYKKSGRKDWNTFQKEYKEKTLS